MKITFQKISTKNLATLAERIISSSKNGQYKVVENHELLLAVENEYKPYDTVYSKLTYSGKGPEIAEADETRDKAFSSLKQIDMQRGRHSKHDDKAVQRPALHRLDGNEQKTAEEEKDDRCVEASGRTVQLISSFWRANFHLCPSFPQSSSDRGSPGSLLRAARHAAAYSSPAAAAG